MRVHRQIEGQLVAEIAVSMWLARVDPIEHLGLAAGRLLLELAALFEVRRLELVLAIRVILQVVMMPDDCTAWPVFLGHHFVLVFCVYCARLLRLSVAAEGRRDRRWAAGGLLGRIAASFLARKLLIGLTRHVYIIA